MSENISITEGGKPRPFGPVKALMVQGEDGKYYPWVPESERQLGYKSIDKNGVYQAKKDGVYGWSSVSVNVPTTGSVTGKDPATGQEVYVHPDPETGELVTDVLPARIEVTTPPTKTEYTDGEAIDYSGIVVKAYYADGTEYEEIRFDELIISVENADLSQCKYNDGGEVDISNVDRSPLQLPDYRYILKVFNSYQYKSVAYGWTAKYTIEEGSYMLAFNAFDSIVIYAISNKAGVIWRRNYLKEYTTRDGSKWWCDHDIFNYNWHNPADSWTVEPKLNTVSKMWDGNGEEQVNTPYPGDLAYLVYNGVIKEGGYAQEIPVQWPRPGDGAVLETSFNITVTGGD